MIKPDYPNARCTALVWVAKWRHYEQCQRSATNEADDLCKVHSRPKRWNGGEIQRIR